MLVTATDSTSIFGDVAFGPDGLLYFTDTVHSKVYSFDPKSNAGSATLVATIPDTNVNGLSFASSNGLNNGDLYVTAKSGVWLVPTVACVVGGVHCTAGTLSPRQGGTRLMFSAEVKTKRR